MKVIGSAATKASGSTQRNEDIPDEVLAAAAKVVARLGVHKVSMEDIATEAALSRATLYRRFGNRDAIIAALISQQARPFVEDAIRLSNKASSFAEQLEVNTVQAVLNIGKYQALAAIFVQGNDPRNLALIRPVYRELVMVNLLPSLEAAREADELREDLDNEEVAEWLMREFLVLVAQGPWTEAKLQRRVRQFVLPVLLKDTPGPAAAATESAPLQTRLDSMERRLSEIQQAVTIISHRLLDKR